MLDSMIHGGRQAMGELRDMLDALRIRHDGAAEAPGAGLVPGRVCSKSQNWSIGPAARV